MLVAVAVGADPLMTGIYAERFDGVAVAVAVRVGVAVALAVAVRVGVLVGVVGLCTVIEPIMPG